MTSVAKVVTAEPGRIVVGAGAPGTLADEVAVATGVAAVAVRELELDDEETPSAAGAEGDEACAVAGVSWPSESATAGPQADRTSTASIAPAAAGQWRSGGRIMRRDTLIRAGRAVSPNGTILPKQTTRGWPGG